MNALLERASRREAYVPTDEQLHLMRKLAPDPQVSKTDGARMAGLTYKVFRSILRRYHIRWMFKRTGLNSGAIATMHRLQAERDQLAPKVKELADDPSISKSNAAITLGITEPRLTRILNEHGWKWRFYSAWQRKMIRLREMAPDPDISYRKAAKELNLNIATVARLVREHGFKWQGDTSRKASGPTPKSDDRVHPSTAEIARQLLNAALPHHFRPIRDDE